MYLTMDEYEDMGGTITDDAVFERYAAKADATIDRMTHGRIRSETPVRSVAKYAAYALIEAMHSDDATGDGREIASMSNDGMTVNYVTDNGSAMLNRRRRYADIVCDYLQYEVDDNGTLLLYAGSDA